MQPIHVLLVEDNEGDIVLTTEALEEWRTANRTSIARDGKEAIDYLHAAINGPQADMPDLILLDINLPKKNGYEVLQFIRENKHLDHIPVIMLTTSSAKSDIVLCEELKANCFISKPVDVNDFFDTLAAIETFWKTTKPLPIQ